MSRFRLLPTPEQELALLAHCRDVRYVWNLAVEQQRYWQRGRKAPGYLEQCRQLTDARAAYAWLRAGSQTVQQQALRDFAQAMRNFFAGTHGRPTWRKARMHEGFRPSQRCSVCGHVAPGNRKSQAIFECEACDTGGVNADVNAACNIAAGRAVTARGDLANRRSTNREPQADTPAA